MATQIQWRRGTTAQTASFTGAVGEATVDTSKNTLVIHDGSTVGGFPLARESALSANAIYLQASYNQANASFITANSAGVYANGAFVSSNTIQTYVTSANANISLLFSYVNTANANITAAFAAANAATATDATQNSSITAAFTQANTGVNNALSASNYANGAFTQANTAITNALSASNYANASFLTANSATNTATAAFTRANNSISANAGGTITGDLVVTGNLTISGLTTYANTTSVQLGDNIITLNSDIPTSLTPTENAGIEVNRGNTLANSSLLWIEASSKWQANSGSSTGAYFLASEAIVTAAFLAANAAIATDITQNNSITAAFSKANTVASDVIAASAYANGAFAAANTDFTNVSVAAGTYGNTTHYGVVTVAANGRVTSISTFAVSDPSSLAFSIALG